MLELLPIEQRELLLPALVREYPELAVSSDQPGSTEDLQVQIPPVFYERVLDAYIASPAFQRFWTISNLILRQAIGQLDPDAAGMSLTIARLVRPAPGAGVRSLIEVEGRGTPPWERVLKTQMLFLGNETLAGYAMTHARPFVAKRNGARTPAQWLEWEESAMAVPIMRGTGVAGCLLASSALPVCFLPFRQRLRRNFMPLPRST